MENYKHLCTCAGVTPAQAVDLFRVNISTERRWRSTGRAPYSVILLLKIMAYGLEHLPTAGEQWAGWTFRRGLLACNQETHTPATILSWHWVAGRLQAMRATENSVEGMEDNVVRLHRGPAHRLTDEAHRRLNESE